MHEEATARDVERLGRKWDSVANDNCFSDDSLASVKRYEAYGRIGCADAKMGGQMYRDKMTDTRVKIQIVGTPDVSRQQITQLRQYTGLDHLVCEFGYGGLSHREAELNLRLFADRAMPVLRRDKVFTQPPEINTAPPALQDEGVSSPPDPINALSRIARAGIMPLCRILHWNAPPVGGSPELTRSDAVPCLDLSWLRPSSSLAEFRASLLPCWTTLRN